MDKLSIANEMACFDCKDRKFYDELTDEERKKFSNYLMIRWGSSVNGSKEFVLGKLLKKVTDKKIWFINDRIDQTKELAVKFKRITPILKFSVEQGTLADYKNSGLPYFKTLTEIYNYVKKY